MPKQKARVRKVFRRERTSFTAFNGAEILVDDRLKSEQVKPVAALYKNSKPTGRKLGILPKFSFKSTPKNEFISRRRQDWNKLIQEIRKKGFSVKIRKKVEDQTPFLEIIKDGKKLSSNQIKELVKQLQEK